MNNTRNSKVLKSFVEYCEAHPYERFWQALRNWSGCGYIVAAENLSYKNVALNSDSWEKQTDTFNWEGKNR